MGEQLELTKPVDKPTLLARVGCVSHGDTHGAVLQIDCTLRLACFC